MCKSVEYIYGYKTLYKNLIGTHERHQQLGWEGSPQNSSARQQQNKHLPFQYTYSPPWNTTAEWSSPLSP